MVGAGKSCHTNVYTRKSGKCDGWPRTSEAKCKEYCDNNAAPSKCESQQCKYVIWSENRDFPPGWCQLATDGCKIGNANSGHKLLLKDCLEIY